MKLNKKCFITLILLTIIAVILALDGTYELNLKYLTFHKIAEYLIYIIFIILITFQIFENKGTRKRQAKKTFLLIITIISMIVYIFVSHILNAFFHHNEKKYSLVVENNELNYSVKAIEYSMFGGTKGELYVQLNPLLLKRIDIFYFAESDYSPIETQNYFVKYNTETDILYFYWKVSEKTETFEYKSAKISD